MNKIILLILILFVSCKNDSKNEDEKTTISGAVIEKLSCGIDKRAVGTWENANGVSDLVYKDDCTYTSSHCQGEGKIIHATTQNEIDYAYLIIKQENGATGCLPKGTYLCAYKFNSDVTLSFTCDGETVSVYTKIEN